MIQLTTLVFSCALTSLLVMISAPGSALATQTSATGDTVVIDNFAIDRTEVTIARFRRVYPAAARHTRAEQAGGGVEYNGGWVQRPRWVWHAPYGQPGADKEPVVHVTWSEAQQYCRTVGGQLPTKKQWQQAAYTETRNNPPDGFIRGTTYQYPVGDAADGMNTSDADPWPRHAPAGATRAGVNGLHDMGANVWEWLADRSDDNKRALTAGGSWWYGPHMTTVDGFQFKPADFSAVYIGFRCVYDSA